MSAFLKCCDRQLSVFQRADYEEGIRKLKKRKEKNERLIIEFSPNDGSSADDKYFEKFIEIENPSQEVIDLFFELLKSCGGMDYRLENNYHSPYIDANVLLVEFFNASPEDVEYFSILRGGANVKAAK